MAPYRILRQGYMHKEPPPSKRGLRKKLHRYWFVLVEDEQQVALVYFKCEDDFLLRRRNEGVVRVDNALSINVVGEYMGCKNALSVKTPRNDYGLVAESKYEVHEWLYALHNALEGFRKKHRRPRQSRRRANTIDATNSRGGASAKTPPPTPTRKAPPPPLSSADKTGSVRRKPVRPAPAAPIKRQSSSEVPSLTSPANSNSHPTPLGFGIEPFLSQEVPDAMMGYIRHPTVDMEFSQGEEERAPLPMHQRSTSDNLVMMREKTRSLPDLMDPNVMSPNHDVTSPTGAIALKSPPNVSHGHTRHLSLTGSMDTDGKHFNRKKRSARRHGSLKHRSRSPPELPPPPPPPDGQEIEPPHSSNNVGGFSQVMSTITTIDKRLDEMNESEFDSVPQQPTIPAPRRAPFSYTYTSPVPEQPMEEDKVLAAESGDEGRVSPEGAHALPDNPLAADLELLKYDSLVEHRESSDLQADGRKKQVMFKEEVEDIPSCYEPRVDKESNSTLEQEDAPNMESGVDEDIPRSVAALKRMLFGEQEDNMQRYSKEGSLSPRYMHPENFVFEEGYNFDREVSPANHNNNNVKENLYDQPWENKPVAKYKVIGVRRRGKEYSPPAELRFGEVLAVDTPMPGNTELCNVNSLERASKEGQESLLTSINTTLQACARYGSDSLLARPLQTGGSKETIMSTRRELEKIRAAHKRDDTELNGHTRMALSLDELDDTHITFDSTTQTHILRSLV